MKLPPAPTPPPPPPDVPLPTYRVTAPDPSIANHKSQIANSPPLLRIHEFLAGDLPIARLTVHITPAPYATLQILDLAVHPDHRRQKHATRLLDRAIADARTLLAPAKLRRVYAGAGHSSHVAARAFLTHLGFHHVGTTAGLYRGEDLLMYIKSFT